jgi:hypothetical protein
MAIVRCLPCTTHANSRQAGHQIRKCFELVTATLVQQVGSVSATHHNVGCDIACKFHYQ